MRAYTIKTTCSYNRKRRKLAKWTKSEQNQDVNFYRQVFNSIFLLTQHSSLIQNIFWNWKHLMNRKCRLRKSFDRWYYIVICATLRVSFSSKSQATNIFPKYILKSKARDKSIQARKKLQCHGKVKNHLCNVLCKFLIKFESMWRGEIKEQAPQRWIIVQ